MRPSRWRSPRLGRGPVPLLAVAVLLSTVLVTAGPAPTPDLVGPPPMWRVGVARPVVVVAGRAPRATHVVALSLRTVGQRPEGRPAVVVEPALPVVPCAEPTAASRARAEAFAATVLGRPSAHRVVTGRLAGPSAGLAFALALLEAELGSLAGGATVAATGAITPWGLVIPVGEVVLKAAAADAAGAAVLVVARRDAPAAASWGRPVIDLGGFDLEASLAAAVAAGAAWDGGPVVVAVQYAQVVGAFLCAARGTSSACALAATPIAPPDGAAVDEPLLVRAPRSP